jgi:predicted amidophosphoribosyltransferase
MILDSIGAAIPGKSRLLIEGVRDLFVPEACFLCSAPLLRDGRALSRFLCPRCLATVRPVEDPVCFRCGEAAAFSPTGAAEGGHSGSCPRCGGRDLGFERCAAGALYGGAVKDLILRIKFSRDLKAALPLGRLALLGTRRALRGLSPDAVTAVPLHPLKRFRRGYNQAALIGRIAAREMKAPFIDGLVRRIRYTPSQGAGGGRGRLRNMRGAFVPTRRMRRLADAGRPWPPDGRGCVLLVDDVISTAATLDHCARALRRGGARTVIGAAAAT